MDEWDNFANYLRTCGLTVEQVMKAINEYQLKLATTTKQEDPRQMRLL